MRRSRMCGSHFMMMIWGFGFWISRTIVHSDVTLQYSTTVPLYSVRNYEDEKKPEGLALLGRSWGTMKERKKAVSAQNVTIIYWKFHANSHFWCLTNLDWHMRLDSVTSSTSVQMRTSMLRKQLNRRSTQNSHLTTLQRQTTNYHYALLQLSCPLLQSVSMPH